MKVSFLMPAYNKEPYIAESINSFIDQNHRDKELIIIDDHSTDGTEDICRFYISKYKNIRYYRNEKNRGVTYCRNLAKSLATGEIMCVLDADDIAYIQRASIVNKFFTKHPDKDIMYGAAHVIDVTGKIVDTRKPREFSIVKEKIHNEIVHSTVAFRNSVDVLYRQDINFIDDWYFYLDCYKHGYKFGKVDIVIGAYRLEPDGLTYKHGMLLKSKENLKDKLRAEFADYEEDLTEKMATANTQKVRIKKILSEIPRGSRVLDIGCNAGYLIAQVKSKGCSAIGIEKANNLIKTCIKKGYDVRKLDIFDTEELSGLGLFDRIILGDILEHYSRDKVIKILINCLALLDKGGRIIITVPYKHGNYSTKFVEAHVEDYEAGDFKEIFPSKVIDSKHICVDGYAVPYWEKIIIHK